jgi:hypothetical protein
MLSSPTVSIKQTLQCFHVNERILVENILNLLLELELIPATFGQCLIDFDTNNMVADLPRTASLHLYHSSLRNLLRHIEEMGIHEQIADQWFAILRSQFLNPMAHTCLPEHPSAVIRSLKNIKSPFSFCRRDVLSWIVLSANPHRHGTLFKVNGIEVSNNIVCAASNSFTIEFAHQDGSFVAIPTNDTFEGTFFALALSFKYFVHFIHSQKWATKYKTLLYDLIFKAIIAGFPFFVHSAVPVLEYMKQQLPIAVGDLKGDFIRSLNLLAVYQSGSEDIQTFLEEQQFLFDQTSLLAMGADFPDVLSPGDQEAVAALPDRDWVWGPSWLPSELTVDDRHIKIFVLNLRTLFATRKSIIGFPVHLLLHNWVSAVLTAPPFRTTVKAANVIEV